MDFFDKKIALRSAPHMSAFGVQFNAHFAISIFVHAHVAPKIIEFCFAAAAAKICDAILTACKKEDGAAGLFFALLRSIVLQRFGLWSKI
jgi:hypothetical protein